MKLGIDFGTTRIVVAAVDRGNYPLVHFETPDGVYDEWFPSLVSVRPANGGMQAAERRPGMLKQAGRHVTEDVRDRHPARHSPASHDRHSSDAESTRARAP